ncbi:MAG: hypothetical protein J6X70_04845, partial [Muribaculaceae bacterium]|nr:hypothetical protein [Muribaculaceae bacterium]
MSNENINEAQVEQTASQETESINEAKATIEKYATQHSDDFTEEQARTYMQGVLPNLDYWKNHRELEDGGKFEEFK